jgi:TonB-dependent SusC/RagA subfamily outer membrane receptor
MFTLRHASLVSLALLVAMPVAAQNRRVTGRLFTGDSSVPFAGAAVDVIGLERTACADRSGKFSIDAPAGVVRLRITPVGFAPQEVVVAAGEHDTELLLGEHVIILDGLTVIGYSASPNTATTATAKIQGTDLDRAPASTVESAMQGKMAGVSVRSNSGVPGGSYQIDVRGVSTIYGSPDPLVVVDGAIISNARLGSGTSLVTQTTLAEEGVGSRLADINPNDVESIEVLQGPAATLRYGSRASNGVIVITTKRAASTDAAPETRSFRCLLR